MPKRSEPVRQDSLSSSLSSSEGDMLESMKTFHSKHLDTKGKVEKLLNEGGGILERLTQQEQNTIAEAKARRALEAKVDQLVKEFESMRRGLQGLISEKASSQSLDEVISRLNSLEANVLERAKAESTLKHHVQETRNHLEHEIECLRRASSTASEKCEKGAVGDEVRKRFNELEDELRTLAQRFIDTTSCIRDEVFPRVDNLEATTRDQGVAQSVLSTQVMEARDRIDHEGSLRLALEEELKKALDSAILPLQASILDEANKQRANSTNLQSAIQTLRFDVEADIVGSINQSEAFKRLAMQVKEDIEKEVAERAVLWENLARDLKELFIIVERTKHERISAEDMLRKLVLEEERTRTLQLSVFQEGCDSFKHSMENEFRGVKTVVETKIRQRRQIDDDLNRRIDEMSVAIQHEHANREVFETLVGNEINDCKQLQKNERLDVNSFVQRGLQAMEAQTNSKMVCMESHFQKELDQCNAFYEALKQRIVSISEICNFKSGAQADQDAKALFQQAQSLIEKESRERQLSEHILRQQLEEIPLILERRPKTDRTEFDLMEEVRLISQKHMEGTMNIWSGQRDSTPSWHAQTVTQCHKLPGPVTKLELA